MFPRNLISSWVTYKWIVPPLLTMMTDPTHMRTRQHLDKCDTEHLHPPFFFAAMVHALQHRAIHLSSWMAEVDPVALVPLGFPLQPHRCPMSLIFLNLNDPVESGVKTPTQDLCTEGELGYPVIASHNLSQ